MAVEYTTLLEGLRVMIRLGIHPEEAEPQPVMVSVAMTVELNDPNNPTPARSTRRVTRIIPLACGRELDVATATTGGLP